VALMQVKAAAPIPTPTTGTEVVTLNSTTEQIKLFVYVAVIVFLVWFLAKMIKDGHIVILFIVGIAILAAWFFLAGDKTGDGMGDSQIISVVQPDGNDLEIDTGYSEVNKNNTTANVITAASFLIYTIAFIALVIGLGFAFVLKSSM